MKRRKQHTRKGPSKASSYVPDEALAVLLEETDRGFHHQLREGINLNPIYTFFQPDHVHLTWEEIFNFVWSYWEGVNSAAGRLAHLLSQAVVYRHGLGNEEFQWVKEQVADYAKRKLSRECVKEWLGLSIAFHFEFSNIETTPPPPHDPNEIMKLQGFESYLSDISQRLEKLSGLTVKADRELRLALALMGSEKVRIKNVAPRVEPSWEEVMKRKSYSHGGAAEKFHVTKRTIRRWIKDKVLNQTAGKRVQVNDNFHELFNRFYGS